jgi:Zn-dependent protease/predicted transcriptional regulator
MFTNRIPLFTLFDIKVGLDYSWFFLAILLVWSLMAGYFPWVLPGLDTASYLWMAILGAAGLFGSIIFHEYAHALVARRYDLPISRITLFIFGGVAEMDDEPRTAAAEFWMAIAGPIASFLLAAAMFLLVSVGPFGLESQLGAILGYLGFINLILAVFNLLPAFPLDGGRMLRAAVWHFTEDFQKATRIAAATGSVLAIVLIGLGVYNIAGGAFVQGIWQMLIGFFVYSAAGASRAHAELRGSLHGVPVSRIMRHELVTVPADTPVQKLVDDYFYRHFYKVFPVVDGTGRLVGVIGLKDVANANRDDWRNVRVADIMKPLSEDNTVPSNAPAYKVLQMMQRRQNSRLLVVDGQTLKGMVTMRDIMGYLAVRDELEPETHSTPAAAPRA